MMRAQLLRRRGIDAHARRRQPERGDRLTERQVHIAVADTEGHDAARPQHLHQRHRERDMPGADAAL